MMAERALPKRGPLTPMFPCAEIHCLELGDVDGPEEMEMCPDTLADVALGSKSTQGNGDENSLEEDRSEKKTSLPSSAVIVKYEPPLLLTGNWNICVLPMDSVGILVIISVVARVVCYLRWRKDIVSRGKPKPACLDGHVKEEDINKTSAAAVNAPNKIAKPKMSPTIEGQHFAIQTTAAATVAALPSHHHTEATTQTAPPAKPTVSTGVCETAAGVKSTVEVGAGGLPTVTVASRLKSKAGTATGCGRRNPKNRNKKQRARQAVERKAGRAPRQDWDDAVKDLQTLPSAGPRKTTSMHMKTKAVGSAACIEYTGEKRVGDAVVTAAPEAVGPSPVGIKEEVLSTTSTAAATVLNTIAKPKTPPTIEAENSAVDVGAGGLPIVSVDSRRKRKKQRARQAVERKEGRAPRHDWNDTVRDLQTLSSTGARTTTSMHAKTKPVGSAGCIENTGEKRGPTGAKIGDAVVTAAPEAVAPSPAGIKEVEINETSAAAATALSKIAKPKTPPTVEGRKFGIKRIATVSVAATPSRHQTAPPPPTAPPVKPAVATGVKTTADGTKSAVDVGDGGLPTVTVASGRKTKKNKKQRARQAVERNAERAPRQDWNDAVRDLQTLSSTGARTTTSMHAKTKAVGSAGCIEYTGEKSGPAAGKIEDAVVTAAPEAVAPSPARIQTLVQLGTISGITKPLITGVQPWFGGVLFAVSADGNCFGYSSILASLAWSAQDPSRLHTFTRSLQTLYERVEYLELDGQHQYYITSLVDFVKGLGKPWGDYRGISDGDKEKFGANVAMRVLNAFLGPNAVGYQDKADEFEQPWLVMTKGAALAYRILDVARAPPGIPEDDMLGMRSLCQSVCLDNGHLRPGRGVEMHVDLRVEFVLTAGERGTGRPVKRRVESYLPHYLKTHRGVKQPVVKGLVVRKGTLPHFDVLADSNTALAKLVVETYGLDLRRDDSRDLGILHREARSQVTQSDTEVCSLMKKELGVDGVDIEQQRRLLESYNKNLGGAVGSGGGTAGGAAAPGSGQGGGGRGRGRGGRMP